ncbi:hypothetical protein HYPSUDRAFT_34944 [Hypholoma sublateritium FD-334 SS-4]|uniref:Uncharacterized protein n=1 Tax=Hypholoma sublateritium (strain FD-334 SS-4) TaxID=945553 RepID=A0A0D2Q7U7_HYPSF|nr:hypothetical protein HYPSUDRAFT_34944 [Hypholoma sublateritium FD-334 SS-4]
MASCQTWAPSTHIRHPWFDAAVVKRKHRDTRDASAADSDSDSEGAPAPAPSPVTLVYAPSPFEPVGGIATPVRIHPSSAFASSSAAFASTASGSPRPSVRAGRPPPKRRRCSPIENGLAQLSLSHEAYPRVQELPAIPLDNRTSGSSSAYGTYNTYNSDSYPYPAPTLPGSAPMDLDLDAPMQPAPVAYTVEEPSSAPEVSMRGPPAWYEAAPDRIVITDLDAFEQEDEDEERSREQEAEKGVAIAQGMQVNAALLARIRARQNEPVQKPVLPPESQALVLFKPLPLTVTERATADGLRDARRAAVDAAASARVQMERAEKADDAMDVEP